MATKQNLASDDGGSRYVNGVFSIDVSGVNNPPSTVSAATPKTVPPLDINPNSPPGRRMSNPLSTFSTYTYNLSLYMITPQAYQTFIDTGRQNIEQLQGGVYIVAQSAGVDDKSTIKRPPGFEFDYYIDNLRLKTATGGKSTQQDSNVTSITFDVIEPNGFSFITKLTQAQRQIKLQSYKSDKVANDVNPLRQFFLLRVSFTGYDSAGNVVATNDTLDRYYDIYVTSLKFNLSGKHTTYNITASSLQPGRGQGNMHGRINSPTEVYGRTVGEALGSLASLSGSDFDSTPNTLMSKLNYDQQILKGQGFEPMEYDVQFIGPDSDSIKNAKLQTPQDIDNVLSWAATVPGLVERTKQAMNETGKPVPNADPTMRRVSFANGVTILQAINNIISRSTYLTNALKDVYDSNLESTSDQGSNTSQDDGQPIVNKTPTTPIRWYNVTTRLSNFRYDTKRRDYAYRITYEIRVYKTPNVVSSFVGLTDKYYGPHKRYEYWFTGLNSEIISYDQTFNSAWYMADYIPDESIQGGGGRTAQPAAPLQLQNIDRNQSMGIGSQAQASYLNYLYSPGDQVKARITILGDPDFLIQDSPSGVNRVYNQFYGDDGFTIGANGGQVFIEINFNEAIDYKSDGTMGINDSILFWAYSPEVRARVRGNSYMVLSVESEFSRGSFRQTLNTVINPLTALEQELKSKKTGSQRESAANASNANSNNNPTDSTIDDAAYAAGPGNASIAGFDYAAGPGNASIAGFDYADSDVVIPPSEEDRARYTEGRDL